MHWRNWSYRILFLLASAVFVFSGVKLAVIYVDAGQSSKQIRHARALYYEPEVSAPAPFGRTIGESGLTVSEAVYQPPLVVQERFLPLLKINPDVVGWLRIDDTTIDYPVVQSGDNEYYLTRDLEQQPNANGSIFMDYRNRIHEEERHWILYGHNMKNKTMFMPLLHYESRWFFDHHAIIQFDTIYGERSWQVFSAYFTDIHDDYIRTEFASKQEFMDFKTSIQNKSLHKSDVEVSAADTILTLSTCSSTNDEARFVVHAKLIP